MSQTINTQSPEFLAAVQVRAAELVADAAAAQPPAPPPVAQQVISTAVVERTSIGVYNPPADEVTVQFTRFTLEGRTSYMAGQQAGFAAQVAQKLVNAGRAIVVHARAVEPRATGRMARRSV